MDMKIVYVSYYLNSLRLGGSYVIEGSDAKDRRSGAKEKGICYYNRIVFENRKGYHSFKVKDCNYE